MKANSIAIVCSIQMLGKHVICIHIFVQLFVSCLVSCVNHLHYWMLPYAFRRDIVYTSDSTRWKQLYPHNMQNIMCIYKQLNIVNIILLHHSIRRGCYIKYRMSCRAKYIQSLAHCSFIM